MILVDSSVWISYFRGTQDVFSAALEECLRIDRVCISGVIEAELYLGAKTKKLSASLDEALSRVFKAYERQSLWKQVGLNGVKLKSKGITVPLSDLVIATHCIDLRAKLLHNDRHYLQIAKVLNLNLFPIE